MNLSSITSLKVLRSTLSTRSVGEKLHLLQETLNKINEEVEVAITREDNALAIWKLSQAVIFEDEILKVERQYLSERVKA